MIHPKNTSIMWGTYNITKMFNLVDTTELPSTKAYTISREYIPNGKTRQVATVNSSNTFGINVARDNAKANLDILAKEFDLGSEYSLRITDNTTGEVIAEYQNATLTNYSPAGSISDGSGNNILIEWSCTNDL